MVARPLPGEPSELSCQRSIWETAFLTEESTVAEDRRHDEAGGRPGWSTSVSARERPKGVGVLSVADPEPGRLCHAQSHFDSLLLWDPPGEALREESGPRSMVGRKNPSRTPGEGVVVPRKH